MKFISFKFIILFSVIILLGSCLGTTQTSTTLSTNPCFNSLAFKADTSNTYLSTAVFTLVETNASTKDSIIVNLDSLPYKTKVDSVYPTFTFKSSAGAKLYFTPLGYKFKKDSAVITGTDTVDFRQPVRVKNYATDGKTNKSYYIKVNVHSVDPEVYNWSIAANNNDINSINATSQKAIILNDMFFYYLNNGSNSYLYNSTDGYTWNSATVNGLPTNTPLNDMIQFNGKIFLSRDGFNLYSSTNGIDWTKESLTVFNFKSLLFVLNNQLWAVVQSASDASYHFAISNDGAIWNMTTSTIPDNFPVTDFASISFSSPSGKSKALVVGGYSTTGSPLLNRWSTEDGTYWVDFSAENKSLTSILGSSLIWYDSKLLLFGQIPYADTTDKLYYKQSIDEGLSWQTPDTLRNHLPAGLTPRNYQSVVVFKPRTYNKLDTKVQIEESNRIFIIGGKSGSTSYSDVWTGKLRRKNFLLQ